jgi:hypothetical protein
MNAARDGGRLATPGRTLRSTDKFQQCKTHRWNLMVCEIKTRSESSGSALPGASENATSQLVKSVYNTVTFYGNDQMLFLFMRYYTAISTRRLCTIRMYRHTHTHTHTQVGRLELVREWRVETDREIKESKEPKPAPGQSGIASSNE